MRFPGKVPGNYTIKWIKHLNPVNCCEGVEQKFKQAEMFSKVQTVPGCIIGYLFNKIVIVSDLPYIPCLRLGGKLSLWLYYGNQVSQAYRSGK